MIDFSRDEFLTEFGKITLKNGYMTSEETSPQEAFFRASKAFASNDEHAHRMYDYVSNLWVSYSTPVLSNGGTKKGMSISCFSSHVPDSRVGILDHVSEISMLSSFGGGTAGYWGKLRSNGTKTSAGSKSTGIIPFIKMIESATLAFLQGHTRRAGYAAYLDISHPEIIEFINFRKPTGGDELRKCMELHHGVCLTDKFMNAVEKDLNWDLIDPHTKEVKQTLKARHLFQDLLELRLKTGEPYFWFVDTAVRGQHPSHIKQGLLNTHSNLCVAPETVILTDEGHVTISDVCNKIVKVWNGEKFSQTVVRMTGENQKLIKLQFSDGSELDCTEYHKFYVQKGYKLGTGKNKYEVIQKEAKDLTVGDKLIKLETPVVEFDKSFKDAYTQGFFSGDGCRYKNKNHIDLYGEKLKLVDKLNVKHVEKYQQLADKLRVFVDNSYEKFEVPNNCKISDRLDWLAGLMDSDGALCRNGNVQITSTNFEFLVEIKLMLQTLGIQSKIIVVHNTRSALLPNGLGGKKLYNCKKVWRILISSSALYNLQELGLVTNRLKLSKHKPNRSAEQFVKIVNKLDEGRYDTTYCFNEPEKHMGVFNGILTGNCSEIALPTNDDRTFVCCLSSLNLEKWNEWKDNKQFIPDVVEFLDNVMEVFIKNAPDSVSKAQFSASMERSLGLGALGWHSLLQSEMIPFEGPIAVGLNKKIFSHIKKQALETTKRLAVERGAAPDYLNCPIGDPIRNMHLLAVAPNASSSIICGETSPSIEPFKANIFIHKTKSGSFIVKNKHLEKLLEEKNKNTDEIWKSISENQGSVSHLDFLSDWEKSVFKTAIELDQNWIIQHAADRQEYICQAQSLNLFFPADVNCEYLLEVHYNAWKKGLKSLYYLRSTTLKLAEKINEKIERTQKTEYNEKDENDDECLACGA